MISDVANSALAAALTGWLSTGLAAPGVVRVEVGDPVVDECCDGLLILSLGPLTWWNPFPFEATQRSTGSGSGGGAVVPFMGAGAPCAGTLGALAFLWVGRCLPVMSETGAPPDPEVETAEMLLLADLTQTIATSMVCGDDDPWAVGGADWLAVEGGCILGRIALRLDDG